MLILAGGLASVMLLRCWATGTPPYSPFAYALPALALLGLFLDPHPFRSLREQSPRPPVPSGVPRRGF